MAVKTVRKIVQHGFSSGEIAPNMYGRIDDVSYQKGASSLTNFLVRPQGAVRSRPGFEYICTVKDSSKKVRLLPFTFLLDQTAILEFGDRYIRFIIDGSVLLQDGEPYEIESPYTEEDLDDLHYEQSGDVFTLVHYNHPPRQLIRYGAYDWRIEDFKVAPTIQPPIDVTALAFYPSNTNNEDKEQVECYYVVTSVNKDEQESVRSDEAYVKGNIYVNGAYNRISWSKVDDAIRYRVYRKTGGVYGFIGYTEDLYLDDDNLSPETTDTPPKYDSFLEVQTGIKEVNVINGGSGYEATFIDSKKFPSTFKILAPYPILSEKYYEKKFKDFNIEFWVELRDGNSLIKRYVFKRQPVGYIWTEYDQPDEQGRKGEARSVFIIENFSSNLTITVPDDIVNRDYNNPKVCYLTNYYSNNKWEFLKEFIEINKLDESSYSSMNVIISSYQSIDEEFKTQLYTCTGDTQGVILNDFMNVTGQNEDKEPINIKIKVTDETGTGAKLIPNIKDGKITSVTIRDRGQNYKNPTLTVESDVGSGAELEAILFNTDDYYFPGTVALFQQRRWFAGAVAKPLTVWATKTGSDKEMSYHLPYLDEDRIKIEVYANNAERVLHIVPLQDLIMLTRTAEFKITAVNGGSLATSNISVSPQSYIGSSMVQPIIATNQAIYCDARGGHIRELGYNRDVYGYLSNDLSIRSSHLFDNKHIIGLTYQKAPWPRVYAISSDGYIAISTYMPEQSLCAWSKITTPNGSFKSIASVPEGGLSGEDALYVIVERTLSNGNKVKTIERMGIINEENPNKVIALDGSLSGDFESAVSTVKGLNHLEGLLVCALADGEFYKDLQVKNGSITLPKAAKHIHVGLNPEVTFNSLPMILPVTGYGYGTQKTISRVFLQLRFGKDILAGPNENQLTSFITSFSDRFSNEPIENSVKEVGVYTKGKWCEFSQVVLKRQDCLPFEINSISYEVEIG